MKFRVGDLAIEKTLLRPHTSYNVNQVVAIVDGALLLENYGHAYDGEIHPYNDEFNKPGSLGWRGSLRRFQEDELVTPDEAVAEIKRLEDAKAKLEKEFEGVRSQIQSKMDQAAALVQEAADLAKAYEKDFYDLRSDCRTLYQAMSNGGWSHSSMKC